MQPLQKIQELWYKERIKQSSVRSMRNVLSPKEPGYINIDSSYSLVLKQNSQPI